VNEHKEWKSFSAVFRVFTARIAWCVEEIKERESSDFQFRCRRTQKPARVSNSQCGESWREAARSDLSDVVLQYEFLAPWQHRRATPGREKGVCRGNHGSHERAVCQMRGWGRIALVARSDSGPRRSCCHHRLLDARRTRSKDSSSRRMNRAEGNSKIFWGPPSRDRNSLKGGVRDLSISP